MIPPRTKLEVLCSSYAIKPTPPSFSAAVFGVPFGYPRAPAVRALLSRGFLQLGMQQKIDLPSLPFPNLTFAHKNCVCPFSQDFLLPRCLSAATPAPLWVSRLSRVQPLPCWYSHVDAHGSRGTSFPSKAELRSVCTHLLPLFPSRNGRSASYRLHPSSLNFKTRTFPNTVPRKSTLRLTAQLGFLDG